MIYWLFSFALWRVTWMLNGEYVRILPTDRPAGPPLCMLRASRWLLLCFNESPHLMYDGCISPSRCRGSQMWIKCIRESLLYWERSPQQRRWQRDVAHFSCVHLSPQTKAAFLWASGFWKVKEHLQQPLAGCSTSAGRNRTFATRSTPCTVGMTQQML